MMFVYELSGCGFESSCNQKKDLIFARPNVIYTSDNGYQFYLHQCLIRWILTGISPKKFKPFDFSLALIMSNLANGKVKKINNSVLVQTILLYCIITSF